MLGMGLVVNDFIGRIKWRNILAYNPVEYFALILAASGVIISLILGILCTNGSLIKEIERNG